jgi:hypothetical protein
VLVALSSRGSDRKPADQGCPCQQSCDYKLHFARWNGDTQPLDVWVRDKNEWQGWQEYWPKRNDFNRSYIFALMQFYHEEGTWLFGGVFRVLGLKEDRYEVQPCDEGKGFIGRLKLQTPYRERSTRVNFENHFVNFTVSEILREAYTGRSFPGYDDIDISFAELETLVRNDRADWKAALENIKGIYLHKDRAAACRLGLRHRGYLVALVRLHCNRSRRERRVAFTDQRAVPRLLPSAFPVCLA